MYKRMTWLSRYYDAMLFCFIVYFTSKLVLGDIFDVKILTPIFLKRCFLFLAFSYINTALFRREKIFHLEAPVRGYQICW